MKVLAYKIWISEGSLAAMRGFFYPIVEYYIRDLELSINKQTFMKPHEGRYGPIPPADKMGDYPDPVLIGIRDLPYSLLESVVALRHSLSVDMDNVRSQLFDQFKEALESDKDLNPEKPLDNDGSK